MNFIFCWKNDLYPFIFLIKESERERESVYGNMVYISLVRLLLLVEMTAQQYNWNQFLVNSNIVLMNGNT